MLWIFLFLRKTYSARTGLWPFDFPFACGHCGAQCAARVMAEGFGSCTSMSGAYSGQAMAQANAAANLNAVARSSFARAACPSCGKFPPALMGLADHSAAARAESLRTRHTWALGVAAVFLFLGVAFAGLDKSGWLALTGLGAAIAFGLITFNTKTPRVAGVRETHPQNVAFFWNGGWQTPQVSYTPQYDSTVARSSLMSGACYGGASLFGLGGLVTFVMWISSFHQVYVVNTETDATIDFRVDGKSVGTVSSAPGVKDAPNESFTVRNGSHVIEAYSANNVLLDRQELEVETADHDYVFAPHAKENGACFARVVTTYNKSADAAPERSQTIKEALFRAKWDDAFEASPSTVSMDQNTSQVTRVAIRAYVCKNGYPVRGSDSERVPFRARTTK
jgi:hypothetical protein